MLFYLIPYSEENDVLGKVHYDLVNYVLDFNIPLNVIHSSGLEQRFKVVEVKILVIKNF